MRRMYRIFLADRLCVKVRVEKIIISSFLRPDAATFRRILRNSWRIRLRSSSRTLRYLINLHDCINETAVR